MKIKHQNAVTRKVAEALLGPVVDMVLLYLFLDAGVTAGTAGLVSLPVAAVAMYVLGIRMGTGSRGVVRFSLTVVMTAFLRAGVLAWMERIPHCPTILIAAVAAAAAGLVLRAAARVDWSVWGSGDEPVSIWRRPIPALLAYAVLLHVVYLGLPELIHEEAYYWDYSRHLALSYLDHPPMVAWLNRAFTTVLGQTELGVRAGAFASWLVGAFFVFRLARRVYDSETAAASTLVFAGLPVYFLAGLLMTPDAPLVACWAATLYFFYRVLIDEAPTAWWGVGVFLGLGMLSKYTMALLGFAVLAFMLTDRRARRLFLRPWPWLAAGMALLLFSPVIVWNSQHEWMSFAFQSSRRIAEAFHFSLPNLLGAAAILVTPVGLAAVAVAAFSRKTLSPSTDRSCDDRFSRGFRLLMFSVLLPLAVFVFFSLFRRIKLDWTGPLWLGAVPFMGHMMATGWPANAGRWRARLSQRAWARTCIVLLLIYGAAMHYVVLGFHGLPYPQNRFGLGWPELARKIETVVEEVQLETGVRPFVVGMDADRLSSWLAFYLSEAMAVHGTRDTGAAALDTAGPNLFGGGRSHMYSLWFPSLNEYRDRSLILVGDRLDQLEVHPTGRRLGPTRELHTEKNGESTWQVFYRVLGPVDPAMQVRPH